MGKTLERIASFFAPMPRNGCGTCGKNLEGKPRQGALSAPGIYCSDECADEATSYWGW